MQLRYGTNPHQSPAVAEAVDGRWPLRVVHGVPSMINLLDALGAWTLVRTAAAACGAPAATSFKHVSPAGAALAGPLDATTAATLGIDASTTGRLTSAYARARDADPRASYGDMIAVSEPVDAELAALLRRLPSDGIVAPGYAPGTVAVLAAKKGGRFLVLEADPTVTSPPTETREVGGIRITQPSDDGPVTRAALTGADGLPDEVVRDLLLGLVTLRHTQSNAVAYVRDGVTLGVGAGQQSRIGCTRLAGAKADTWRLRRHPQVAAVADDPALPLSQRTESRLALAESGLDPVSRREWLAHLDGVALVSDGALPFRDNVDEAARHGVRWIAEPGGSIRSPEVEQACAEHGIERLTTAVRLFRH